MSPGSGESAGLSSPVDVDVDYQDCAAIRN